MTSPYHLEIGRRRKPLVGWLWHLAAALASVAMFLLWPKELPALGGPAVLAFVLLPLMLYRQGHRHFMPSARQAEQDDPQPPILYLRSFADEPALRVHEEVLARILSTRGPFVAIGDPSDPLPQIAAARDYLPHDGWQEVVLSRLKRSQLVVLVAGSTPGLGWEVAQCKQYLDPRKLLIIVPANKNGYDAFSALCDAKGITLVPYEALGASKNAIAGLITFDENWKPVASALPSIVVLDPIALFEGEEATWRRALTDLRVGGIVPGEKSRTIDLGHHWRLLPLATFVIAAVYLLQDAVPMR